MTVLPPRLLSSPVAQLVADLKSETRKFHSFEIELGEIEIFPVTNVIYLSLKSGREQLEEMHQKLALNHFAYREPFPFHPHVTLAQEVPVDMLGDVYARAAQRWMDWNKGRKFVVDNVVFVRNVEARGWEDLSEHALRNGVATLRTA